MHTLYAPLEQFAEVTVALREIGIRLPNSNARKYVWDFWQACALLAGVREDVSEVGRSMICAYYTRAWPASMDEDIGVPAFQNLILHALTEPAATAVRWNELIAKDGKL